MNVLIIDDIKLIGKSIEIELAKNTIWNTIMYYHYNVENSFKDNVSAIASLIIENKIDVLCLDRGYSKIYEDDENYIYSSIEEEHRGIKVKGEEVLLGKEDSEGLLEQLIVHETNLKSILIYTYDKGNNEIDNLIECIKEKINHKLTSLAIKAELYCFETSSIFNKPLNPKLYPNSFYISPTYKEQFIDYKIKKRNIGSRSAYIEYGQLVAFIINDLVLGSARTIYSFFNSSNIQYDSFQRSINNLHINNRELRHEYYTDSAGNAQTQVVQKEHDFSKLNLSTVSALFNINDQEKYIVDIPFKEYYFDLNESIKNKGLLSLFKDKDGCYLKNQFVIYCYNFINNSEFHLYECHTSSEIELQKEIIKAWLPILHSGAFHSTNAWKCKEIKDCPSCDVDYRITMLFYFDSLEVFGYDGHINFTFYQEGSNRFDKKKEIEAIKNYKVPLLKAKASEILIPELKIEIQNQATRAAISQVMARNMSHNIGSHVMNALITDSYLENFKVSEPKSYKANIELDYKDISNYNQLRIYNNYVKTRMDYLADITFGTPVMLIAKMAYAHIFCELDRVRLLLDNISGRGDQFKYSLQFVDSNNRLLSPENDIPLAIPNDVLGCQAFYNIIENVIRNTAKHANSSEGQKLFTVRIKDGAEFDCSENSNTKEDLKEYYAVEIFDDIALLKDTDIIQKQNIKLNDKILSDNNALRSESLGLVEMDASAAYLRQLDIVSINSDEYDVDDDDKCLNSYGNINILKAFNAGTKDNPILGYRFFIKKPQEVLVITEDGFSAVQNDLSKNGITLLVQNEFRYSIQNGKKYNHQFLVVDDSLEEVKTLISKHSGSLPLRIYYKSKVEISELLPVPSAIESKIWKCRENELIKDYSSEDGCVLTIYTRPMFNNCKGKCESSFESHLYNLKEKAKKIKTTIEEEWKNNCETKFYHEALSSKADSYLPNNTFKKLSDYLSKLSEDAFCVPKTKLAESILCRIIVIDERIQEILEKQLFDISYNEHFKMSNIYLPPINMNLKGDSISIEEVNNFIDDKMKIGENNIPFDFNPKFDFILIHYSLLERAWVSLSEDEKKKTPRKDWINSWLEKYKDKATIVVTSGRGNLKDLPNHVRFTNLSSVTTALKEIKSKYLIHQIIYASRTTK